MHRSLRPLALTAIVLTAACGDSNSPSAVNPAVLQSRMTALAGTFQNNAAFQSLVAMSFHFPSYAGTALMEAGNSLLDSRLEAGRPVPPRLRLPAAGQRLAALRDIQALFPANVLGKTLEWNTQQSQYVIGSQSGAPANGIRILIYLPDAQNGGPQLPLQQLGYLELTDESTPQFDRLGVLLRVLGQTIADYDITHTTTTTSSELAAVGRLHSVDLARHADFDLSATTIGTSDFALEQHIDGSDGTSIDIILAGDGASDDVEIRVAAQGSELALLTTETATAVNGSVLYNGVTVATITGDPADPTITGLNGREIPASELAAIGSILIEAVFFAFLLSAGVFGPAAVVF